MYYTYYYANVVGVAMVLQWFCSARSAHAVAADLNRQLRQLRYGNFVIIIIIVIIIIFLSGL